MALPQTEPLTEAEYLALDEVSEIKHEFANGEIFAMTGASWTHNLICVNTSTSLNVKLSKSDYSTAGL